MEGLNGYKPEIVTDEPEFKPIKGKGFTCNVNRSMIEDVPAGESRGESYEGYQRLKYELEIIGEPMGLQDSFLGRKVWKSFNLDSTKENKKGKTPVQQLSDVFFTVGLEFSNITELRMANEKFSGMELNVSFAHFKGDEDRTVQMHTIIGKAENTSNNTSVPSF